MKINIRHEEEKDYHKVEDVAREAFYNLYIPGAVEHLLVHKLRKSPSYLKELSYVIEVDGEISGGIFYTKAKIVDESRGELPIVSFGPVFIHPKYHRQGLGRELITHTIDKAKKAGYKAIATTGYSYHYAPYGFLGGKSYNLAMSDGNFYKGLLILPLYDGALKGISGHIEFSDDLVDPSEVEVAEFDKAFPPKEKKVLPSQAVFAKACVELDD